MQAKYTFWSTALYQQPSPRLNCAPPWENPCWKQDVTVASGSATLLKPDNITISPEGNLWLFEDPDRAQRSRIKGLADDGTLFTFAENDRSGSDYLDEFAGGCFSADGKWLFVNIQTPGVTLAITGPFGDGVGPDPVIPEFPTGVGTVAALGAAAAIGGAAIAIRNRNQDADGIAAG